MEVLHHGDRKLIAISSLVHLFLYCLYGGHSGSIGCPIGRYHRIVHSFIHFSGCLICFLCCSSCFLTALRTLER
ncbi:hypothetical protein HanXRQr2_Chr06g0243981 [Helianthus annuus]|uniref:Uncharacterized protein n=1 Tax=Helianthus annuus TaxID=4232 RepID=A0A9K3NIP3_HELAN|nr:hypothetical protein HanXRQr2_Chr06g0243981 [Helianthus annuus]